MNPQGLALPVTVPGEATHRLNFNMQVAWWNKMSSIDNSFACTCKINYDNKSCNSICSNSNMLRDRKSFFDLHKRKTIANTLCSRLIKPSNSNNSSSNNQVARTSNNYKTFKLC